MARTIHHTPEIQGLINRWCWRRAEHSTRAYVWLGLRLACLRHRTSRLVLGHGVRTVRNHHFGEMWTPEKVARGKHPPLLWIRLVFNWYRLYRLRRADLHRFGRNSMNHVGIPVTDARRRCIQGSRLAGKGSYGSRSSWGRRGRCRSTSSASSSRERRRLTKRSHLCRWLGWFDCLVTPDIEAN